MRKLKIFCSIVCLSLTIGCATDELVYYTAPSQLANTSREMQSAGYWISRYPKPDQIIMDQEQINQFNLSIERNLKTTLNIMQYASQVSGENLRSRLADTVRDVAQKGYYLDDGSKPSRAFFDRMRTNMNLDVITSNHPVQFGFIVHYADQKFFPTIRGLNADQYDTDFDELQNSALDVGTPVAVLHISKDGQWYYVESQRSIGWVKAEYLAICSFDEMANYLSSMSDYKLFVVIINPKADIYLNAGLTQFYDNVRMGGKFRLQDMNDSSVEIVLPTRNKEGKAVFTSAYLNRTDIQQGHLPYTPRNVLQLAFKMNNAPYGWGGMYGEQDCSRLMLEIFSPFGFVLPRNSSDQARVGRTLAKFDQNTPNTEKLKILQSAVKEGMIMLRLRGHIMLYLGMVDNRPYAIHATWGYREPVQGKDRVRVINRVVVTDLSLGEGSKRGSLLDRMTSIVAVDSSS